jgi:hypothetical protein
LPTQADCFGHVVVEALASGLPVIATDVGGISDIIDNGVTGWLIKPGASALVDALEHALQIRPRLLEMGRRGRTVAEQRFNGPGNDERLVGLLVEQAARYRAAWTTFTIDRYSPIANYGVLFAAFNATICNTQALPSWLPEALYWPGVETFLSAVMLPSPADRTEYPVPTAVTVLAEPPALNSSDLLWVALMNPLFNAADVPAAALEAATGFVGASPEYSWI